MFFHNIKPILLSAYTILVIIFPNGMGFKTFFDFRVWAIFAIVLLLPKFTKDIIENKIKLDKTDLIFLSLVLLSSISVMFSDTGVKQIIYTIVKSMLYIYLPYYAGKHFIKNEKNLLFIFYSLCFASIVVSLMAFNEYFTGKNFFGNFGMINPDDLWSNSQTVYQRFEQLRIAASFVQPIYLGTFLDLVILINILILIYYRLEINLVKKIILIVGILLAGVVTLLSQSRTSIVALFIVLILAFLKNYRNIKGLFYSLVLLTTTFLVIKRYFGYYMSEFYYYGVISDSASSNYFDRILAITESIKYIFSYINFFGEGLLRYSQLNSFYHQDFLNGFLFKFFCNGIIYALLYIYLWYKALKESYKHSKYSIIGSMQLLILIYLFIVHNVTMLNVQNEILLYVFLGIIFNPYLRKSINYAK